jgi:glycine hydroxymethyltransferase
LIARGFNVVSGGTDNHLMLIDLRNKCVTGKALQIALDRAGITANKNGVPFDDKSPLITSGIRLGTPAVTTRGMKELHMDQIADFIARVTAAPDDPSIAASVKEEVVALTSQFLA